MAGKYDHLDRDTLVRLLERRDADRQLGLIWEREELESDNALNDDYVALDLDPQLSHGDGPWPNLIIEGDNYDALRALRATHKKKIRCIYIDPPYNTGNRDFVYNDHFVDKTHRFRHSLWLEFMYQRLRLAKELLSDDGVIFVSIDDNELFRLGLLAERVFGEENQVGVFCWIKKKKGSHLSRTLRSMTEYVLCYTKNISAVELFGESAYSDKWQPLAKKTNAHKTLRFPADFLETSLEAGPYSAGRYGNGASALTFLTEFVVDQRVATAIAITGPFVWTQAKLDDEIKLGTRVALSRKFGLNALRHDQDEKIKRPSSLISAESGVGTNEDAFAELTDIFGSERVFSYPKPSSLIEYLVRAVTYESPNSTILDFFAGSGTTAHAVAKLNAEDGGNRKFILVSSTEATAEKPDKNLCRDVCSERVRRVMLGYVNPKGETINGLGGSFAYLRTRRVPKHRLSQKLTHGEIWNALELTHGYGLSHWPGTGLATRTTNTHTLAYLADFKTASVDALLAFSDTGNQATTILYSWAPDRARELLPHAQHQPVPQFLRDRFGNGSH